MQVFRTKHLKIQEDLHCSPSRAGTLIYPGEEGSRRRRVERPKVSTRKEANHPKNGARIENTARSGNSAKRESKVTWSTRRHP